MDASVNSRSVMAQCIREFEKTRKMCEAAISQLSDEQLHVRINEQQNSIAVIMQHMAGNMVSRFTDFLTSDGEKPDRDREREFAERQLTRAELLRHWSRGWQVLLEALQPLTDADLQRVVTIRNEPHTVFEAVNRQTAHYGFHAGQILLIGKHILGKQWKYLTIAPGGSGAFNAAMRVKG